MARTWRQSAVFVGLVAFALAIALGSLLAGYQWGYLDGNEEGRKTKRGDDWTTGYLRGFADSQLGKPHAPFPPGD
jgi:hypothetical protein